MCVISHLSVNRHGRHVLLLSYDLGKSVELTDEVPLVHASLRNMNDGDNPPFSKSIMWNRKLYSSNDRLKHALPYKRTSQSCVHHLINLYIKY
jgi:hypothetical protein